VNDGKKLVRLMTSYGKKSLLIVKIEVEMVTCHEPNIGDKENIILLLPLS